MNERNLHVSKRESSRVCLQHGRAVVDVPVVITTVTAAAVGIFDPGRDQDAEVGSGDGEVDQCPGDSL